MKLICRKARGEAGRLVESAPESRWELLGAEWAGWTCWKEPGRQYREGNFWLKDSRCEAERPGGKGTVFWVVCNYCTTGYALGAGKRCKTRRWTLRHRAVEGTAWESKPFPSLGLGFLPSKKENGILIQSLRSLPFCHPCNPGWATGGKQLVSAVLAMLELHHVGFHGPNVGKVLLKAKIVNE